MTGPEHYSAAEILLDATAGPWIEDGEQWKVAAAQVHATLALAAAVALGQEPKKWLPDGSSGAMRGGYQ